MYKKSLLSAAIASTLLTGCLDSENIDENNASSGSATAQPDSAYVVFNPAFSDIPIPNDLIFDSAAGDGSFFVGVDPNSPPVTALDNLSGASTVAPIDIKMSALIDDDAIALASNVFLVQAEYASGDALQGLLNQEPPTVLPANQPTPGVDYSVEAIELDGTSYIRISPNTPLDPLKRYIVVITNGILDTNGDNIQASPTYQYLSDENSTFASDDLATIAGLINGLWEPLAMAFLAGVNPALTEDNIALTYSFTTSGDEKVLGYIADPATWLYDQVSGFVGVSTATAVVAGGIDVAGSDAGNNTTVGADGTVNYHDIALSYQGALAAFPYDPAAPTTPTTISTALDPLVAGAQGLSLTAFDGTPCATTMIGPQYIQCASATLVTLDVANGGFADLLPTPAAASSITVDHAGSVDAYSISSLTASILAGPDGDAAATADNVANQGEISITQGTLTLPYYLGMPAGANGSPIITENWKANSLLATTINRAFADIGLALPQGSVLNEDGSITPPTSDVVNYIFPFPESTGDVTIPFLAIHPTAPGADMKTVIYQHGITTDRSAALGMGVSMVGGALDLATDVAVIAIDQPLHGVDGINTAEKTALAESLLSASGNLATDDGVADGVDDDEQATLDAVVDGTFSAGVVAGIDAATNSGAMGATNCIDLATNGLSASTLSVLGTACDADPIVTGALGGTASTVLGSALLLESTVSNGSSVIPGLAATANERHFDFTASTTTGAPPVAMDYSGSAATNRSGSMFINLLQFMNMRDNGRQQVLDLLTLRKSLGDIDLLNDGDGTEDDLSTSDVYFIGHSLGTLNGIPFVAVANNTGTTTDDIVAANFITPGGGLSRTFENSPVFGPLIVGGLGAAGLTQDMADFQTYLNVLQHALDSVDPINFVQDFEGNTPVLFTKVVGDTFIPNSLDEASEVFGDGSTSPLAGTDPLIAEATADALVDTPSTQPLTENVVNFIEGTHETPVFPSSGTNEESAAFAEMIQHATSMVVTGGAAIVVDNTSGIDVLQ